MLPPNTTESQIIANVGGGDIEIDYVAEMNFESPDGQRGSVPRP